MKSERLIFTKKEKRTKKERKVRKEKPVETAAAVEIQKGGLRQHFLDGFPPLLEKAVARTAPAFSQLPQARRRLTYQPIFKGSGYSLRPTIFCPKNGEHLRHSTVRSVHR
jgi:hypothetical protein